MSLWIFLWNIFDSITQKTRPWLKMKHSNARWRYEPADPKWRRQRYVQPGRRWQSTAPIRRRRITGVMLGTFTGRTVRGGQSRPDGPRHTIKANGRDGGATVNIIDFTCRRRQGWCRARGKGCSCYRRKEQKSDWKDHICDVCECKEKLVNIVQLYGIIEFNGR